jgi:hypothetical protein
VPRMGELLVRAAVRGHNIGSITIALNRLRQHYSIAELNEAVAEALERDVPHPNAVRLALDRRREQRGQPLATAVTLPEHLRGRDIAITPHALSTYDQLKEDCRDDYDDPSA